MPKKPKPKTGRSIRTTALTFKILVMAYRINERNIGYTKLDGSPKKRGNKLTASEIETVAMILQIVYDAMEEDEITGTFTDGGRITLSLTGEQMYDLFEAKRKMI